MFHWLLIAATLPAFAINNEVLFSSPEQWSEEEKSDFAKNYSGCTTGDSTIDLSQQFEPTECQRGGSCTTYSAVSVFGAALFRNDSQFSVSSETDLLRAIDIDEGSVILRKAASENGPQITLKAVADMMNAVDGDCKEFIKMSSLSGRSPISMLMDGNGDGYLNGKFPLEFLLCEGEKCEIQKSNQSSESSGDALVDFVKVLVTLCHNRPSGKLTNSVEIQQALQASLAEREHQKVGDLTQAYTGLELWKESAWLLKEKNAGDLIESESGSLTCTPGELGKRFIERRTLNLRSMLCLGIPTDSTVNFQDLEYEYSQDGGKSWKTVRHSSPGIHAMAIQGLEHDKIVFRNSWETGNDTMPAKSQLRIPISESCRVANIAAVVGEKDRSRMNFVQLPVDAQPDQGGLPLGFRISNPRKNMNHIND